MRILIYQKLLVPFLIFSVFSNSYGQYLPTSKYLIHPENNIQIIKDNADYWSFYKDEVNGGFYNYVSFNNAVSSSQKKSFNGQSRLAFSFTKAFMVTGDQKYLNLAKQALDFLYQYGWDEINGGWFAVCYKDGTLSYNGFPDSNFNTHKAIFQQHYSLLGISAFYEATRDTFHESWFRKGLASNENMWDDDPEQYGYYHTAELDWSNPSGKSFTATVDAITTHLLQTYLIFGEEKYKNRLKNVADNIIYQMLKNRERNDFIMGFPEDYYTDWTVDESSTDGQIGHILKTAWCLLRIYNIIPNENYKTAALELIKDVWENAYDNEYGGPFAKYEWKDVMSITEGKIHWCNEQAYASGMFSYSLSDNDDDKNLCLKMADETIDFHMNKMIDPSDGSTFVQNSNSGNNPSGDKGSYYNAGYHTTEFAYYGYLYGNLFHRNKPVTLYYKFDPLDQDRTIVLNPLSADLKSLKILSVALDGNNYDHFIGDERRLDIPANEGGIFKVEYAIEGYSTKVEEGLIAGNDLRISGNYPNPWIVNTTIAYTLPQKTNVEILLIDLQGNPLKTIVKQIQMPGEHRVQITRDALNPGIYFYIIKTDSFSKAGKMLLLNEEN